MTVPSPSPTTDRTPVLDRIEGGLVVSCQARPGQPLFGPGRMAAMAAAAVEGGASGIRVNGLQDVTETRAALAVPVIGLWKDGDDGVYITPTLQHAVAVARAGADIVALDATARPRRDGLSLAATIERLHDECKVLVMADVSTFAEGVAAARAGADLVGTTLSGYTRAGHAAASGPDLPLVTALAAAIDVPVVAEGRITTPEQAVQALRCGAFSVVVGAAITSPTAITSRFLQAMDQTR